MAHWAVDYVVFPIALPFIVIWIAVATLLSLLAPLLIFPTIILTRRLYWAAPLVPYIWHGKGIRGFVDQIGFEVSYTVNVCRRMLTLPLRRNVPDFVIVGFPRCGSIALASYLRQHPAIAGLDGMPWHPLFSMQSHFFNGVLGPSSASSKRLYRSFFPTILSRWFCEAVRRAGPWKCFDACPLTGALGSLAARRLVNIAPNAKLIFVVRDPVEATFSAEIMLRNLGMPLEWSFMEDVKAADPRFAETIDDRRFWQKLESLAPDEPLPNELPAKLYGRASTALRCAHYADRVEPFLERFPKENIMFVEFSELTQKPEEIVPKVLDFVGVSPAKIGFKKLSLDKSSTINRRGRRMHPAVRRKLRHYFAVPNQQLFALIGKEFSWQDDLNELDEEEGYGGLASSLPVQRAGSTKELVSEVDLLPGRSISLGRKSTLVKRSISINASTGA